jgi:hypothetical protein
MVTVMNAPHINRRHALVLGILATLVLPGCWEKNAPPIIKTTSATGDTAKTGNARGTGLQTRVETQKNKEATTAQESRATSIETKGNKAQIGKNVWLEVDGDKRRVLVSATVCARQVPILEQFMCRKLTKEHEAILAADCDAVNIHAALLAAKALAGHPVEFQPKFTPPTGTVIKVYVQYEDQGKVVKVPAQSWIRDIKTKKELAHDWVFAGSYWTTDTPRYYAANDGNVICVRNLSDATLDLAMATSQDYENLDFEPYTQLIPPVGTPVLVILEPALP